MSYLSKKTRKLITTLTLVGVISSTVPVIVGANTLETKIKVESSTITVNQAYKAAHKATIAVRDLPENESPKTIQGKINEARTAIKTLSTFPGQTVNVQTLSPIVDKKQHPILKNIVDSINAAKKAPSQKVVDKARATIPENLPPHYKASYSSALDTIQKSLMKIVDSLLQKGIDGKNNDHLVNAGNNLKEIKSSPYTKGLSAWITAKGQKIKIVYTTINLPNIDTNGDSKVTIKEAEGAGFQMPIHKDHWLYPYMNDNDGDGMVGESS